MSAVFNTSPCFPCAGIRFSRPTTRCARPCTTRSTPGLGQPETARRRPLRGRAQRALPAPTSTPTCAACPARRRCPDPGRQFPCGSASKASRSKWERHRVHPLLGGAKRCLRAWTPRPRASTPCPGRDGRLAARRAGRTAALKLVLLEQHLGSPARWWPTRAAGSTTAPSWLR